MASRKISDLHPDMIPLIEEFLKECERQGLEILVTCTYRSNAEQDELYAKGRTKPGNIVTNAKAGQSKHNFTIDGVPASKALDFVPVRNGKLIWGTSGEDLALWLQCGKIAEFFGLEWAGRWKRFKEFPHIQLPD
jgi:peptidoglycan LD-endopeptidase CwlK